MKTKMIFLIPILVMSCGQPAEKIKNDSLIADSNQKKVVGAKSDTIKATKDFVIVRRPDLQDTTFVDGNHVVFLRPDSIRFESYARDKNSVIYDADAKFGGGISTAIDTILHNKKFNGIRVIISSKRYVSIVDCKTCPQTIDRDSIDYGVILTGKGKDFQFEKNNISDGQHYIKLVRDYFKVKK